MRITVPRRAYLVRLLLSTPGKIVAGTLILLLVTGIGLFSYAWVHYSRLIDQKLRQGPFRDTAKMLAAPEPVSVGDKLTADELVRELRRRGYSEARNNRVGWYNVRPDAVEIFPGVDAYPRSEPGVIFLQKGGVTRIVSSRDNTERPRIYLEPELFTNLYDRDRTKRRLIRFNDIPPILVHAVISIEDKRFFQHSGFDPLRIIRTAWVDVTQNRRYGASTLTMQLAREFWLDQSKTFKRKAAETMITLQLEQRLSKEEIFEYYANQVDLGRRGSFAVRGFGEAAQVYFGKDVRDLKLSEAALLAGLIQRPNYLNPFRHPERALQRRNIVLSLMRENGYISQDQYEQASQAPVKLTPGGPESNDAPYFVDLVYDTLQDQFQDVDFQEKSYRVYTTLDMNLQRDAMEAVQIGLREVDEKLAKRKKQYPQPQVAMVVLDPQTAEVKALIGGRNYGQSQLNRVLSRRQPGSIFKPFVYAAALGTAIDGSTTPITPVTTVVDEPTTFWYDGKPYEPNNFKQEFHGTVALRQALAKSMNIPAVKFAEMAGFDKVAQLARASGLEGVRATPAVALGSYDVTPLDIADAYTIFSNQGNWVKWSMIREIRSDAGQEIFEAKPQKKSILDPRISYMVVNLMQEVLRSGTGAGARSRGFYLPAAGKTGTSHDAWFAGFTTKLLCVVWVGFDNNEEMPLTGGDAALPIWTEFMKRAHQYREYRGAQDFEAPDGIVTVEIDPVSGQLATPNCIPSKSEVFIAGTQPQELCSIHGGGGHTQVSGWDLEEPAKVTQAGPAVPAQTAPTAAMRPTPAQAPNGKPIPNPPVTDAKPKDEKRGIWGKFRSIFK